MSEWNRYAWSSFFFKQKTAYEMRISDWSSDVCSPDLALRLRRRGRRPLLVATDLKRPAAVTQLQVVGQQVDVPVYAQEGASDPIAEIGRASCRDRVCQYV